MSDSWMTIGTPLSLAPYTTGTDTNPPLEKTTLGLSLRISAWGLKGALDHAEGVGEIFEVEIPAQFAHGDGVAWKCHVGISRDELLLDGCFAAPT